MMLVSLSEGIALTNCTSDGRERERALTMWHSLSGRTFPPWSSRFPRARALASVQTIDPPMPLDCAVRLTGDEASG